MELSDLAPNQDITKNIVITQESNLLDSCVVIDDYYQELGRITDLAHILCRTKFPNDAEVFLWFQIPNIEFVKGRKLTKEEITQLELDKETLLKRQIHCLDDFYYDNELLEQAKKIVNNGYAILRIYDDAYYYLDGSSFKPLQMRV
jgi:hypothetical protein